MDKDNKTSKKQSRHNSTNRKTLLNGQFTFKDDDNVVCVHCNGQFKYHRSTSTLSYHLRTKHAFVSLHHRQVEQTSIYMTHYYEYVVVNLLPVKPK